jgi:hypothetical protein
MEDIWRGVAFVLSLKVGMEGGSMRRFYYTVVEGSNAREQYSNSISSGNMLTFRALNLDFLGVREGFDCSEAERDAAGKDRGAFCSLHSDTCSTNDWRCEVDCLARVLPEVKVSARVEEVPRSTSD